MANLLFTLLVFIGVGRLPTTNKQIKVKRQISVPIIMIETGAQTLER